MPGSLTRDTSKGPPRVRDFDWGGDSGPGGHGSARRTSKAGLMVLMAATTALFAAFTTAFILRRASAEDWVSTPKPAILYVNTAILLASSISLEKARRAL